MIKETGCLIISDRSSSYMKDGEFGVLDFCVCTCLRLLPRTLFPGYEVNLMSQGMSVPFSNFP